MGGPGTYETMRRTAETVEVDIHRVMGNSTRAWPAETKRGRKDQRSNEAMLWATGSAYCKVTVTG